MERLPQNGWNYFSLCEIPLKLVRIELKVIQPLKFKHFFHGNVIRSFLLSLFTNSELNKPHNLPAGVVPVVVENGYVAYRPGYHYVFGLVLVGEAVGWEAEVRWRLQHVSSFSDGVLRLGSIVELNDFLVYPLALEDLEKRLKRFTKNQFLIRLLTPLWIDREAEDVVPGHRRYDRQLFRFDVFYRKIFHRLENLRKQGVIQQQFPMPLEDGGASPYAVKDSYFTWLELPTRKRTHNYGGILGHFVVEGELKDIGLPLLIGQFLHIGEKINFGFGYYDLPEICPELSHFWRPAQDYVQRMVQGENLQHSFQKLKQRSQMPGVDDVSLQSLENDYSRWEDTLLEEILHNEYRASPLLGMVITDRKNKLRALAVPTLIDRWLQRALVEVMEPAVDTLLEDCSFAFRKNYSRQRAREALRRAYQEGYRYVLESDIENFFDEVEWPLLLNKLKALYPYESVIPLIEQWISVPVEFRGQRIQRSRGLPQGAVISPILSNFYLDEFDEKLQAEGFKLVRFADDFVILCKSRKEAEQALTAARKALEELDLELNLSKTRITHFDEGFHYLGYLFCRSVIIEKSRQKEDEPFRWELLDEHSLPPNSWLARCRIAGKSVKEYVQELRYRHFRQVFSQQPPLEAPEQKPVYLGSYTQRVRLKHHTLRIEEQENRRLVAQYPIQTIQSVVLLGSVPVSMPMIHRLLKYGIPIFFCDSLGAVNGMAVPPSFFDPSLWQQQHQLTGNAEFALAFSQEIVKAKIHNYLLNLRFVENPEVQQIAHEMLTLQPLCENKTTLNALRGIEGRAAALFYQAFALLLDREWHFPGRRRRPAPDPINALLSLGYTILHNRLTSLILSEGLNPWQGIFHQARSGFCALSSDLQEEFRFLVDRLVLTLIRRGQFKPQDFPYFEKSGNRYLLPKTKKAIFIQQLEQKFLERVKCRHLKGEYSYLEIMHMQVKQLKQIIQGQRPDYQAFRRR